MGQRGGELAVGAVEVAVGLVVQRVHVVCRGRAHRRQLVRGCVVRIKEHISGQEKVKFRLQTNRKVTE